MPTDVQAESRRSRHRRELVAEILDIARRQLEEGGRSGVSLRAIAREVGMNPASLYTYFAGLDDLFTALLLQSFERLGEAIATAHTQGQALSPVEGALGCVDAYRSWAVEHPAQFNLLFTDAIPGYEAPDSGGTREAEQAIWNPFLTSVGSVIGRDLATDISAPPPHGELTDEVFGLFGLMHGLVMLEINHHTPPTLDIGELLKNQMRCALERLERTAT